LPDKGFADGLHDPEYFVEVAGLVDLLYFAEAAEHLHLELVDY
jgi:hypothetical protein